VRNIAGTLDFYWRIRVDEQQPDGTPNYFPASWFHLQDFVASSYDANWRQDEPGRDGPVFFAEYGEVVFHFIHQDPNIPPWSPQGGIGSTYDSRFFFLHTDATRYAPSATFSVDMGDLYGERIFGVSGRYATFAPAPVPEPASWALMLIGGIALAGFSLGARSRKCVVRNALVQPQGSHRQ